MALVNCPECGKEVSDKAYSCPVCGFPVREHFEEIEAERLEREEAIALKEAEEKRNEELKERANRFDEEMAFCIVGKDLRYTKNRVISITLNYEIDQCKDMVTRILADYVKKDKFRLPEMDFDSFNDTAMNLIKETVRFFWMYCADMMERFYIDRTDDDIDLESDFYDEINQYDIRKEMISVYKEAQRTIQSFENDTDYELSNLFVNATYESGYSKSLVASILDEVSRSRAEKKIENAQKEYAFKRDTLSKFYNMKIIMVITNKLSSFANIAFKKTKNFLIESHNLFKFSECRIRSNYIQTHIEEINSEIKKNGEKKKLLYDALQECPCVPEIYEGAFNQMVLEKKDIEEILRLIEFAGVQKLVMFRLNESKNPAIDFFDKSIPIEDTIKKASVGAYRFGRKIYDSIEEKEKAIDEQKRKDDRAQEEKAYLEYEVNKWFDTRRWYDREVVEKFILRISQMGKFEIEPWKSKFVERKAIIEKVYKWINGTYISTIKEALNVAEKEGFIKPLRVSIDKSKEFREEYKNVDVYDFRNREYCSRGKIEKTCLDKVFSKDDLIICIFYGKRSGWWECVSTNGIAIATSGIFFVDGDKKYIEVIDFNRINEIEINRCTYIKMDGGNSKTLGEMINSDVDASFKKFIGKFSESVNANPCRIERMKKEEEKKREDEHIKKERKEEEERIQKGIEQLIIQERVMNIVSKRDKEFFSCIKPDKYMERYRFIIYYEMITLRKFGYCFEEDVINLLPEFFRNNYINTGQYILDILNLQSGIVVLTNYFLYFNGSAIPVDEIYELLVYKNNNNTVLLVIVCKTGYKWILNQESYASINEFAFALTFAEHMSFNASYVYLPSEERRKGFCLKCGSRKIKMSISGNKYCGNCRNSDPSNMFEYYSFFENQIYSKDSEVRDKLKGFDYDFEWKIEYDWRLWAENVVNGKDEKTIYDSIKGDGYIALADQNDLKKVINGYENSEKKELYVNYNLKMQSAMKQSCVKNLFRIVKIEGQGLDEFFKRTSGLDKPGSILYGFINITEKSCVYATDSCIYLDGLCVPIDKLNRVAWQYHPKVSLDIGEIEVSIEGEEKPRKIKNIPFARGRVFCAMINFAMGWDKDMKSISRMNFGGAFRGTS